MLCQRQVWNALIHCLVKHRSQRREVCHENIYDSASSTLLKPALELQETVDTLLCTTIRPPHTYSLHFQFQLAETLWDIYLAKLLILHLSTWSARRNLLDLKACVDNKDSVVGTGEVQMACLVSSWAQALRILLRGHLHCVFKSVTWSDKLNISRHQLCWHQCPSLGWKAQPDQWHWPPKEKTNRSVTMKFWQTALIYKSSQRTTWVRDWWNETNIGSSVILLACMLPRLKMLHSSAFLQIPPIALPDCAFMERH